MSRPKKGASLPNVELVPVEEVKPYEKNPRIINDAINKVAASIKEFGFRQPILVDEDNVIIAGHTRLAAAKKLGLKTVPVIKYTDLTPKQVKALRLADNKTAEFSYWDMEGLLGEMDDILREAGDIDLASMGFDMGAFTSGGEAEDDTFTDDMQDPENNVWNLNKEDKLHFTASLTYPAEFKEPYTSYINRKGNREALINAIMSIVEKDNANAKEE